MPLGIIDIDGGPTPSPDGEVRSSPVGGEGKGGRHVWGMPASAGKGVPRNTQGGKGVCAQQVGGRQEG